MAARPQVPASDGSCTQCSQYTGELKAFFGWVLILAIVLTVIGVTISWSLKLRVIGDAVPHGSIALSRCTTAHPLHTRFTAVIGTSISELTIFLN